MVVVVIRHWKIFQVNAIFLVVIVKKEVHMQPPPGVLIPIGKFVAFVEAFLV